MPEWAFFIAKYFGSGVIIATAFIHLLAPANEALSNECLTGAITEYPWVEGIALMTVFTMFFVELMAMRFDVFGSGHGHSHSHSHTNDDDHEHHKHTDPSNSSSQIPYHDSPTLTTSHTPGDDHLGHSRDHIEHDPALDINDPEKNVDGTPRRRSQPIEDYAAQITAICILEFGVIFHSVFVGLTLAVAGDEFKTLYVVLVFHQTFEGLGLGSRLATTPWPPSKRRWTPYLFGLGYALSTPLAIAIGLGVRQSWAPGSATALIVNGVFDSISAGILVYTGLVELMAHEFMFSPTMRRSKVRVMLAAFGMMALGAGLMALLGKWA